MGLYRCDWRSRAVFRWSLGAMVRCLCSGLTRDGARCKITSDSKIKDKHGRLASLPLQLGGQFCLFHARVLHELALPDGRVDFALFYIDLETDGLDVFRDNIVEIAALSAGGAPFSSLVVPPGGAPAAAPSTAVHGISDAELQTGLPFAQCSALFVEFVEGLADSALVEDSDSSEELPMQLPVLRFPAPRVLLAAHNGRGFDFPMLLCNQMRRGGVVAHLGRFAFVDTLDVCRVMAGNSLTGGCLKLGCLFRSCSCASTGLRFHRALDDCIALQAVVRHMADGLGLGEVELLSKYAFQLDLAQTCATAHLYSQVPF